MGDFNSAKQIGCTNFNAMLTDRGTHLFSAPELRFGKLWNERIDIWACGLCMFFMLHEAMAFDAQSRRVQEAFAAQRRPEIRWGDSSALARNLVEQCLTVKMSDRPPAMELLMHPCFDLSGEDPCRQLVEDEASRRLTWRTSSSSARARQEQLSESSSDIFLLNLACGLVARRSRRPEAPNQSNSRHGGKIHPGDVQPEKPYEAWRTNGWCPRGVKTLWQLARAKYERASLRFIDPRDGYHSDPETTAVIPWSHSEGDGCPEGDRGGGRQWSQ